MKTITFEQVKVLKNSLRIIKENEILIKDIENKNAFDLKLMHENNLRKEKMILKNKELQNNINLFIEKL